MDDYSDKEINDAIDIVGLSEEVNRLGEGIDTWIGDGQLTLSGGQKQRVALARAILNGSHFCYWTKYLKFKYSISSNN
ncbi:ATP-binding cassette domain-containing protein [Streptococcus dysgalactiae subsp. equisimilis]